MEIDHCRLLIEAKRQPVTNNYLEHSGQKEALYDFELVQSLKSGLIRLKHSIPMKDLIPKFDWIKYFEPEDHLDELVIELANLFDSKKQLIVGGISYKDDTTLDRFRSKYGATIWRLDTKTDMKIAEPGAGVESIQYFLNENKAKAASEKYPKADLLIVRHIFEHCSDIEKFSNSLKHFIRPNGYIVFEIPDASRLIRAHDYTMIWEEHFFYFTPYTLKNTLSDLGFKVHRFLQYPYPFEDSLVAVVSPNVPNEEVKEDQNQLTMELQQAAGFGNDFEKQKSKIREFISELAKNKGKIAIFGAGHLTTTFLALFELKEWVAVVADDNPNKSGLYLPYAHIPIHSSACLYENDIKLCLLGVNPIHENKIISNHEQFLKNGGTLLSIFPSSEISLQKYLCL